MGSLAGELKPEIVPILGNRREFSVCYIGLKRDTEVTMRPHIFFLAMAALATPSQAQVYKWTDADGNVHFGSQPPPGQQQEVKIRDTTSSSPSQPVESDVVRRARELEEKNQQKRYERAQRNYERRVSEIREDYDNRPDYACQGAENRLKNAMERWEAQKLQGYTLGERTHHEQRIREARRHRDNICR